MHRSKGFTLVEVMMVVAILAILAAVAWPLYQHYVVKARVSEALVMAGGLKAAVAGNASQAAGDLSKGVTLLTVATGNVASTLIDSGNGTITVVTTAVAGNGTITLTPTAAAGAPWWPACFRSAASPGPAPPPSSRSSCPPPVSVSDPADRRDGRRRIA